MAAADFWTSDRIARAVTLGIEHERAWSIVARELSAEWGVPLSKGAVKDAVRRSEAAPRSDTVRAPLVALRPPANDGGVSDAELARIAAKVNAAHAAPAPKSGTRLLRTLIVPDAHVPYHDRRAWALMLQAARLIKPDRIVVLGDLLDFFCISSHDKRPDRKMSLDAEIEAGNAALDDLDSLGASERYFTAGNHENRLERLLMQRAPELFSMVKLSSLLRLSERGWTHVDYRKSLRVGSLLVTHDTDQAGLHANLHALRKAGRDAIIGHTHRMAQTYLGDADGIPCSGTMLGWLGDASAIDYRSEVSVRHEWSLGFGIASDLPSSKTVVQPIPIIGYQCVIDGMLVSDGAIEAGKVAA